LADGLPPGPPFQDRLRVGFIVCVLAKCPLPLDSKTVSADCPTHCDESHRPYRFPESFCPLPMCLAEDLSGILLGDGINNFLRTFFSNARFTWCSDYADSGVKQPNRTAAYNLVSSKLASESASQHDSAQMGSKTATNSQWWAH
jgi:hypothetical protein